MFGKMLAWSFVHFPVAAELWSRSRGGLERGEPPFVRLEKPLSEVRLGLVTTGGVHQVDQPAFWRQEKSPIGDGSWRTLDLERPDADFVITHDWYEAKDAREDLNLVLPRDRLRELADEGVIGSLHPVGVGLMGHVEEKEERRLEFQSAPEVAGLMQAQAVDAVLLVPA